MKPENSEKKKLPLYDQLKKLNVENYEKHIFLCAGEKCCSAEVGEAAWKELKTRCADLELTNGTVYRTKVHCLRVCQQGPIGLVYPGGHWYKELTADKMEKVIQQDLIGDKPVKDLLLTRNPNFD